MKKYLECYSKDQHGEDQRPKRPVSKHLQGHNGGKICDLRMSHMLPGHPTALMLMEIHLFDKGSINPTDGAVLGKQHSHGDEQMDVSKQVK